MIRVSADMLRALQAAREIERASWKLLTEIAAAKMDDIFCGHNKPPARDITKERPTPPTRS
jgi:hypothetical protein